MQYEPRNPHHLRYVLDGDPVDQKILDLVEKYCIKLNKALGYDFNTVEFAIRDGVPYAIDFCNPAPDADIHSVGQDIDLVSTFFNLFHISPGRTVKHSK